MQFQHRPSQWMLPYEFTQGPNIAMLRHLVARLCCCSLHISLSREAKSAKVPTTWVKTYKLAKQ